MEGDWNGLLQDAEEAQRALRRTPHAPHCYVFDIFRYLTGCRVALGTLVVSISRLTPTNILRICYDSCIYILYDAQV